MLTIAENGEWVWTAANGMTFGPFGLSVSITGDKGQSTIVFAGSDTLDGSDTLGAYSGYRSRFGNAALEVSRETRAYTTIDALVVGVRVKNVSKDTPVYVPGATSLDGPIPFAPASTTLLAQPWERCGMARYLRPLQQGQTEYSAWNGAIFDKARQQAVVIGMLGSANTFTSFGFEGASSDQVRISANGDTRSADRGVQLDPGECITLDSVILVCRKSPYDALEVYAGLVKQALNIQICAKPLVGWCDWYHYYGLNSQDTVLANLEAIDSRLKGYGLEYIQIDAGWQKVKELEHFPELGITCTNAAGAPWTEHEDFKMGMGKLADEIHRKGYKAGLWVRPFSFTKEAEEVEQKAPFLLPGFQDRFPDAGVLDTSHPAGIQWMEDFAQKLTNEWGYDYIKYDFVTYDVLSKRGFDLTEKEMTSLRVTDPKKTSAQAFRESLSVFRSVPERQVEVMACNCLAGSVAGITDGLRISGDVCLSSWPITRKMLQACAVRYYLNGVWWHNDPDVLQVEEPLPLHQARFWASLVGMYGGMVMLGDDMTALTEERLDIYKRILPQYPGHARPLRLFDEEFPAFWQLHVEKPFDQWDVVGVFNWEEDERELSLGFDELGLSVKSNYHVYDFWEQRYLGQLTDGYKITLPGTHSKIIGIRPVADHPQVVGTNLHITQGGVELERVTWNTTTKTLAVRLQSIPGREAVITVAVPEGYTLEKATMPHNTCTAGKLDSGAMSIAVNIGDAGRETLELRFS